jgi:SPX domain
MVEFGLKLQDNKVADWNDYYIRYEKLKAILTKGALVRKRYDEQFMGRKPEETKKFTADYRQKQKDDQEKLKQQEQALALNVEGADVQAEGVSDANSPTATNQQAAPLLPIEEVSQELETHSPEQSVKKSVSTTVVTTAATPSGGVNGASQLSPEGVASSPSSFSLWSARGKNESGGSLRSVTSPTDAQQQSISRNTSANSLLLAAFEHVSSTVSDLVSSTVTSSSSRSIMIFERQLRDCLQELDKCANEFNDELLSSKDLVNHFYDSQLEELQERLHLLKESVAQSRAASVFPKAEPPPPPPSSLPEGGMENAPLSSIAEESPASYQLSPRRTGSASPQYGSTLLHESSSSSIDAKILVDDNLETPLGRTRKRGVGARVAAISGGISFVRGVAKTAANKTAHTLRYHRRVVGGDGGVTSHDPIPETTNLLMDEMQMARVADPEKQPLTSSPTRIAGKNPMSASWVGDTPMLKDDEIVPYSGDDSVNRENQQVDVAASQQVDDDYDHHLGNDSHHHDPQLEARREREIESIQRALIDQYRTAKLLLNFALMNYTGFVKIVKKHDKTLPDRKGRYKKIITAESICNEGKAVEALGDRMEVLYANWFCDRDISEARAQMLPKRGDGLEMDWSQLRLGYRMGMCSVLALWACWDSVYGLLASGKSTIGGRTAFPVFRCCGGLLLLSWFWGCSTWIWTRYRINCKLPVFALSC